MKSWCVIDSLVHENYTQTWKARNDNLDFMGREYAIRYVPCMLGHETIHIDYMGHENSKKLVPWIESHPEIYENTV